MTASAPSFPQFTKLPLELRDQIWGYALPEARVYEVLDSSCSTQSQSTPSSRLMFADARNEPPPAIARVCRDARHAVLRRYRPLVFSNTVKHIDLSRDILLLDSYLQVKRLLKVTRLLSQVEAVRTKACRIALGTSWGFYTGLHLRLFHKTVQTKRNMEKFLTHLSKFRRLQKIILVVYQRSAFNLRLKVPEHQPPHWRQDELHDQCRSNFDGFNFNFDNYFLRRPYQSRLVRYEAKAEKVEKTTTTSSTTTGPSATNTNTGRPSKQQAVDPQPRGHQVTDLKETFEKWIEKLAEEGTLGGDFQPPALETAALTWIYTGTGY
ncbi:hypothetical protein BX600DRAFT_432467 [Xylariales sp. PMI_506]|nr:hypothetical protein BX600DRAFT_432467 [Xylariales sp. PMI_506]